MKVAVQCNSPLLQKSLELFLQNHLTTTKQCDVVLRDKKIKNDLNVLYISADKDADIVKPFSKSQLIEKIEEYLVSKKESIVKTKRVEIKSNIKEKSSFILLEKKIDTLTKNYQKNLLKIIKEHYEEE